MAGGCFRSKISIGFRAETQSWLFSHWAWEQHSGSSQSVKPSEIDGGKKVRELHAYSDSIKEIPFPSILHYLPLSLSLASLQFCSIMTEHSRPVHPLWHLHSHRPSTLALHWPCPLQLLGQPSRVQCFPFQPVTQRQVPFLHWPWSAHLQNNHDYVNHPSKFVVRGEIHSGHVFEDLALPLVTNSLIAESRRPAVRTLTRSANANSVGTTVRVTELCSQQKFSQSWVRIN